MAHASGPSDPQPAARAAFQPYIPATQSPAEFTAKAIVLGALFGLIFGASTVYLGLRAGLTVSASIPIAVLAISVLKRFGGSTNAHDTRAITLSFAEPLAPLSAVRIELLPGIAGENGLPVVPADYTFTTAR